MKYPAFACPRASPCASDHSWAQIGDALACTGPPAMTSSKNRADVDPGI